MIMAVIAMLVALGLPYLISSRESARQLTCQGRMSQLILAIHNYESTNTCYPSGVMNPTGPIVNEPIGLHHSWIVQLLPFIEEEPVFSQIDPTISVYDDRHAKARGAFIGLLQCPSSPPEYQGTSVAACHHDLEAPIDSDNNGVFFLNSAVTKLDVVDGLTFTLFLGEKRTQPMDDLGWLSGTRATLRNTGSPINSGSSTAPDPMFVGSFGSWHSGHFHTAMGDGTVNFASEDIDPIVYRQLGNRSDGTAMTQTDTGDSHSEADAAAIPSN